MVSLVHTERALWERGSCSKALLTAYGAPYMHTESSGRCDLASTHRLFVSEGFRVPWAS